MVCRVYGAVLHRIRNYVLFKCDYIDFFNIFRDKLFYKYLLKAYIFIVIHNHTSWFVWATRVRLVSVWSAALMVAMHFASLTVFLRYFSGIGFQLTVDFTFCSDFEDCCQQWKYLNNLNPMDSAIKTPRIWINLEILFSQNE